MTNVKPLVLHIVPTTLPGSCGVGDYAVRLAKAMQDFGSRQMLLGVGHEHFVSHCYHTAPEGHLWLDHSDPQAILAIIHDLAPHTLFLHLSNFGYDAKAYPQWLLRVLRGCRRQGLCQIATFFHEIWQKPALFSRRLYRSVFQRRLTLEIARLSHKCFTNTRERMELFCYHLPKVPFALIPVFSNVGELDAFPAKKARNAVVFGSPTRRQACWDALANQGDLLARLRIDAIIDVGRDDMQIDPALAFIVHRTGLLPDTEVSALLARATWGLIHYSPADFGKSGIFNAYAAHGQAVLNLGPTGIASEGLEKGQHFLQAGAIGTLENGCALKLGGSLWEWYQDHSCKRVAEEIFSRINDMGAHREDRAHCRCASRTLLSRINRCQGQMPP